MNECDLSDAITETVAGRLNKIKFEDGVECQRGNVMSCNNASSASKNISTSNIG